ncbi:MAG: tetratricopeptide repeat protein [Methanothrix sp.]|nr:tetratricopeptide repeat protein [Methanothrix sp.]
MKAEFTVALLAVAMLFASAMAQEYAADDWLKKGYELMANGSFEEAAKAIQKSIDLCPSPTNATLWDAKAQSLALAASLNGNRSQYNESLKAEDKAIEMDPTNSTFLVNKGFLIANMADVFEDKNASMYEDSVKEFEKAIQLDPKNMDAWNWKGMVLDSRLNRSEEALLAYEKVIEIGGTDARDNILLANAWSAKGGALAKLGRNNESAAAFDRAIELNPQNAASIWYLKARSFNSSGMYDEAVKAYDKAIELSKVNLTVAQAYEGKGSALLKLGKYDEAVSAYDKAIELFPIRASGSTWHKKGTALKALGKQSEADAAFAKAKEMGYQG